MFRWILSVFLAGLCLLSQACPASAEAVPCFSGEELPGDAAGILLRDLPEEAGLLQLGGRILQPGDTLTADMLARVTFSPADPEQDIRAMVGYLPIFADRVGEEASVTISLRGKEDKAPVAEDQALETYKNLPNGAALKVHDPEGEALTYTLVRQPRRGSVELGSDGSFTYTPKKNKVGVDSFTYTASDPAGKVSREATVTITILKPTDAAQYTDTLGKECRFAAEWMRNTGIFVGETLGQESCFGPEKTVTRGEFVTMLVKALDLPVEEELPVLYSDEIPSWLKPYVAAAVRAGLTADLPQRETFGAGEAITGTEAASLLQNALDTQAFAYLTGEPLTRSDAAQALYTASRLSREGLRETLI